MLSDRVYLSSAEARVEEIKGGSVGVVELCLHGGSARWAYKSGSIAKCEDHLGTSPPQAENMNGVRHGVSGVQGLAQV